MKKLFLIICLLQSIFVFSQKTKIIHQSSYKHDFLVQDLKCIEDPNDTAKIKYMLTLQLTDDSKKNSTVGWLNLFRIKAKEYGADTYFVDKATITPTLSVIQLKLFFAGEKFREENKLKQDKNSIYVFDFVNQYDTATFYLNRKKITFKAHSFYSIKAKKGEYFNIEVLQTRKGGKRYAFPKDKRSVFLVIPAEYTEYGMYVSQGPVPGTFSFHKGTTKLIELKYDYGRFLKEIMK